MKDILVIHIGAGKHDPNKSKKYKTLLRNALSKTSIVEASDVIESSPLTNTGYGSSLNLLGKVECDASFITNDKIGAVVNMSCKNPTKELFRVFQYLDTLYESDETDLTSPVMLTYPLLKNLVPHIVDDDLVSEKSRKYMTCTKTRFSKVIIQNIVPYPMRFSILLASLIYSTTRRQL
ncbi:Asparaginase family protein [Candida albicans]|uniref:Asparaginase family protein n=1 Tax=Candida albicans TaxID=5476 RepID=A0A8H6C134_CANAX|nr:Asparaginase family protein [Candida albicans]